MTLTPLEQLASDLRRNASGGDDYPWEFAKSIADRIDAALRSTPDSAKETTMDSKELSERKRAEVDIWDGMLRQKAREYVAQGMSHEAAEERACNDIRREIRASK